MESGQTNMHTTSGTATASAGITLLGFLGALLAAWSAYLKGWSYTWIGIAFLTGWLYICSGFIGCHGGNGFSCNDVPLEKENE